MLYPDGSTVSVLQFYALAGVRKWDQLGYLTLFIGAFFTLFWAAITFIRHEKR